MLLMLGAQEVPVELATLTKPGLVLVVLWGVVHPVPVGTWTETRELAAKSLPAGAVKVNTSELPVEPAVTDVGATVMVPSPLAAAVAMTMALVGAERPGRGQTRQRQGRVVADAGP